MVKVSERFLIRLKLNELPAYRIAQQAGVNPNTLSRLINGIDPIKPKDERIIAVGKIIGLRPAECFEEVTPQTVEE
jgi:lambda repressor-like predicted transcriptional regulator